MLVSDETLDRICKAVPGADAGLVKAVLLAAGNSQIFFAAGEGEKVVDGKSVHPDYLQVEIKSSYVAGRLAQQLVSACADALSNNGVLRTPVLLFLGGQAEISE